MLIYNLLFKGVEIKVSPWCKAFASYDEACKYVDDFIEKSDGGFVCKSKAGWCYPDYFDCSPGVKHVEYEDPEKIVNNWDDWRLEDPKGNSYYFLVMVEEV